MKLFINAANLRFGGGRTVGFNIINYYSSHPAVSSMTVTVPAGCGYERFAANKKVKLLVYDKIYNHAVLKIISNYILLPLRIAFTKTDFILSLGNIAIPTTKTQFLLIHQAYVAYPESIVWKRIRQNDKPFYRYIMNTLRLIRTNLRFVSMLGVQTESMRSRMSRLYKIPEERIVVIPNAVSYTSVIAPPAQRSEAEKEIRLLFIAKYYPHKNYEILYETGKLIAERKLPIKITVTIDRKENEGSRRFLDTIEQLGLSHIIVNHGNVPLEDLGTVYAAQDGLFLPTLLESFSGSYIEAMHFRKLIFTSDMDFAHEVCLDSAYYFDPHNPEDIVNKITEAFSNPNEMEYKLCRGQEILEGSKTWDDIGKFIDDKFLNLAK